MNNPVIATAHFGPVHKRKIHVYREAKTLDEYTHKMDGRRWVYVWSTNAYRTCRDAAAAAINGTNAQTMFRARFAKD